jgi:hypothetical protein
MQTKLENFKQELKDINLDLQHSLSELNRAAWQITNSAAVLKRLLDTQNQREEQIIRLEAQFNRLCEEKIEEYEG